MGGWWRDKRCPPPGDQTAITRTGRSERAPRTRPQAHALLPPGASGRPRSAKPRGRAGVRASSVLGPPGPSRAISAPTHIPRRRAPGLSPRRRSSSSPRRAASPGPRAERSRRRLELPSERLAGPAGQRRGGREPPPLPPPSAPLPLYFLPLTPLLVQAAGERVAVVVSTLGRATGFLGTAGDTPPEPSSRPSVGQPARG